MMCFCMFYIDIHMVHLLGEDEGVAVVGQMVSWGRQNCWEWMKVRQ